MERCYRPSHRRCCDGDSPSFSSSLLDAIYRSIDQTDGGAAAVRDKKHTGGAPDPYPSSGLPSANRKKHSTTATATAAAATVTEKSGLRRKHEASDHQYHHQYHRRPFLISTTSSSSDGSSYGGFSSSDAESAIASSRLKPVRTAAPPARSEKIRSDLPPPPPSHHQEKKKPGSISISIRSRLRDLRKGKPDSAPASPGARLANFINALFSGAGTPRKTKISSPATPAAARGGGRGGDESACSSASSYTRSCLSKTPSSGGRSGGKRSVRFGPVSVVDADEFRPCGRRSRYDEVDPAVARARESRRMVAELLRGLETEEYEDDDGAESDTSSDLFELENLTAIGQGYRDELPVYETTYLATNRAIAQGLIV